MGEFKRGRTELEAELKKGLEDGGGAAERSESRAETEVVSRSD